jgi:hypothetical protein
VSSQPADDARDRTVPPDAETSPPGTPPEGEAEAAQPPAPRERRQLFRRRPKEGPPDVPPPVDPSPVTEADTDPAEGETTVIPTPEKERPPSVGQLRRRRKELLDQRQEVVYHLGGLAFELYRRDRLGEPVMRRRAAEVWGLDESVRDIDLQLEQIERTRRERREERRRRPAPEPVPLGHCVNCGAPWYQPEARFCWSCGAEITHPEAEAPPPEGGAGDDQPTGVISNGPERQ